MPKKASTFLTVPKAKLELSILQLYSIPLCNSQVAGNIQICPDRNLGPKAKQQSPEAHYQQTQWTGDGIQCFKYECCCKDSTNFKIQLLHRHLQPDSPEVLFNQHNFNVGIQELMSTI